MRFDGSLVLLGSEAGGLSLIPALSGPIFLSCVKPSEKKMKKVIQRFNATGNTLSVTELAADHGLEVERLREMLELHSPFSFSPDGNFVTYTPPYGITDSQSLFDALINHYPMGLSYDEVANYCYEYVEIDINELVFKQKCFLHKFGKTQKQVMFVLKPMHDPELEEIWDKTSSLVYMYTTGK